MSPKSAEERDNEDDEVIERENIDESEESAAAGYFPDNIKTVCWSQSQFLEFPHNFYFVQLPKNKKCPFKNSPTVNMLLSNLQKEHQSLQTIHF